MASRDQQREKTVGRIARHLLRTGLSQTSLRQLAAAAGVSDRMLLYYFANKSDAVGEALNRIAAEMSVGLASAIPAGAALSAPDMIAHAAGLTTGRALKPFMALWIEVVAAAARDEAPYAGIAQIIAAGFLDWIESRLDDKSDRKATAAMILAMIDGLALLNVCAGDALTSRAAARMAQIHLPEASGKAKASR